MPHSIVSEFAVEILKVVFWIGGYYVGRVVVPILSFGLLRCDGLTEEPSPATIHRPVLFQRRGGHVYLTFDVTAFAGLLFVVLVLLGGFLIYRFSLAMTIPPHP